MSLLDLIGSHLKEEIVSALSARLGAAPDQMKVALNSALPSLLGAAAKQALSPDSAVTAATQAVPAAATPLADAVSNLQVAQPTDEASAFIDQLLGSHRAQLEQTVSDHSGMDSATVSKLLTLLAPIVIAGISHAQQSGGGSLVTQLISEVESKTATVPGLSELMGNLKSSGVGSSLLGAAEKAGLSFFSKH